MNNHYERPTDELRQVKHSCWNSVIGPWKYYTVQRKWLVQDGEKYEKESTGLFPVPAANEAVVGFSRLEKLDIGHLRFPPRPLREWYFFVKTKEEWRDLPSYTPKAGEGGYV